MSYSAHTNRQKTDTTRIYANTISLDIKYNNICLSHEHHQQRPQIEGQLEKTKKEKVKVHHFRSITGIIILLFSTR